MNKILSLEKIKSCSYLTYGTMLKCLHRNENVSSRQHSARTKQIELKALRYRMSVGCSLPRMLHTSAKENTHTKVLTQPKHPIGRGLLRGGVYLKSVRSWMQWREWEGNTKMCARLLLKDACNIRCHNNHRTTASLTRTSFKMVSQADASARAENRAMLKVLLQFICQLSLQSWL